jgi:MOSC domain-containing protein YiiM
MVHILSVNVGRPRRVLTNAGPILTSIFKFPVEGPVRVRAHNLDGDQQADLTVHGGPWKAVYLYPAEHYPHWGSELPGMDLPYGAFGENLTTEGLTEENAHIGDQFRVGSAILQVTQPRMPCFKLALRFGRADMVKRFWKSGRSGMYFSVVQDGELKRGDSIEQVSRDPEQVSVAAVLQLFKHETEDEDLLLRALRTPLHGSWKRDIQERWAEWARDS